MVIPATLTVKEVTMKRMSDESSLHFRRAFSMIGLLVSMGIMVVLFAITSTMITGTGPNNPGVKQNVDRKINAINLYGLYQGFYVWAQSYKDKYPSTKTVPTMEGDTTHDVYKVLIEDGVIAGKQLISQNEFETGYEVGYANQFGKTNSSYALEDYDVDDWLRYRKWNINSGGGYVLMSDRWVDIPGFEHHSINDTFWYVLYNDGHGENNSSGALRNGDSLFDPDIEDFGENDTLMVHD